MTKAITYGRKSFDDPDRRTASVEDQRMAAAGYAELHGFELAGFFGDNGITGATMERPGLLDLLQAITRADIGVLIIEDVDRLSRDAEHLHYMVKLLRLHRVVVHTVQRTNIDAQLASTRPRITNLVTQLEAATQPPRSIIARLEVLEAEEDELTAALAMRAMTTAPALPEDYEALFRRAVAELDDYLAADDGAAARTMLRGLIEGVVVDEGISRGGKRRPTRLLGNLYRLLGVDAQTQKLPGSEDRGVMLSLVAGTGFEPVTFRL